MSSENEPTREEQRVQIETLTARVSMLTKALMMAQTQLQAEALAEELERKRPSIVRASVMEAINRVLGASQ